MIFHFLSLVKRKKNDRLENYFQHPKQKRTHNLNKFQVLRMCLKEMRIWSLISIKTWKNKWIKINQKLFWVMISYKPSRIFNKQIRESILSDPFTYSLQYDNLNQKFMFKDWIGKSLVSYQRDNLDTIHCSLLIQQRQQVFQWIKLNDQDWLPAII